MVKWLSVCVQHVYCKVVIVSEVSLMYGIVAVITGRTRVDVGLSVEISVTVSVPSNKVRVAIVLTKNVVLKDNQSRLVGCQVSRKLVAIG